MHFLITAGPTREPLDPVRYLSNRSSGRMGYALAEAAAAAGHEVTLISGPVSLPVPEKVHLVKTVTAQEMYDAVMPRLPLAQAAIFAAAVADYRPLQTAARKIKKTADNEILTLTLERTPDILGSARAAGFTGILMGFAAETDSLAAHALDKLRRKGCDVIAANDVSGTETGFDSAENEITLFFADGRVQPLARAEKRELADILVGVCVEMADQSGSPRIS